MTRIFAATAVLTGAVAISACESVGQALSSHTDVLARAGGHVKTALVMGRLDVDPDEARSRLAESGGVIANVVGVLDQ